MSNISYIFTHLLRLSKFCITSRCVRRFERSGTHQYCFTPYISLWLRQLQRKLESISKSLACANPTWRVMDTSVLWYWRILKYASCTPFSRFSGEGSGMRAPISPQISLPRSNAPSPSVPLPQSGEGGYKRLYQKFPSTLSNA